MAAAAAQRLTPKEAAYVEAVKKLTATTTSGSGGGGAGSSFGGAPLPARAIGGLELVREFGAACKVGPMGGRWVACVFGWRC